MLNLRDSSQATCAIIIVGWHRLKCSQNRIFSNTDLGLVGLTALESQSKCWNAQMNLNLCTASVPNIGCITSTKVKLLFILGLSGIYHFKYSF